MCYKTRVRLPLKAAYITTRWHHLNRLCPPSLTHPYEMSTIFTSTMCATPKCVQYERKCRCRCRWRCIINASANAGVGADGALDVAWCSICSLQSLDYALDQCSLTRLVAVDQRMHHPQAHYKAEEVSAYAVPGTRFIGQGPASMAKALPPYLFGSQQMNACIIVMLITSKTGPLCAVLGAIQSRSF